MDFGVLGDLLNVLTFQKPARGTFSQPRVLIMLAVVALIIGAAIYFAPPRAH